MASRLFDPNTQYRDDEGVICAGGSLTFYITNTTTAKNVYAERALSTSLGNVIDLDASGRAEDDFWLASDVLYRVILADADAVQVWSRDDVGDANVGGLVPLDPADGTDGQVYTTDGVDPYWATPNYVPDNSGHSGKYLTTDGSLNFWANLQSYDEDNLPGGITDGGASAGYIDIGNTRFQWGTDTAPTASGITTSKDVTFGQPFGEAAWHVGIGTKAQNVTSANTYPSASYASPTTTGCTVHFFCGGENAGAATTNITSSIPFTWFAIGSKPAG